MNIVSILPKLFLKLLHHQNNIKVALERGFKKVRFNNNEEGVVDSGNVIDSSVSSAAMEYNLKETDKEEETQNKTEATESDTTPIM